MILGKKNKFLCIFFTIDKYKYFFFNIEIGQSENPAMIPEWSDHETRSPQGVSLRGHHKHFLWKNTTFRTHYYIQILTKHCACKLHQILHLSTKNGTWTSPNIAPATKRNTNTSRNTAPATKMALYLYSTVLTPTDLCYCDFLYWILLCCTVAELFYSSVTDLFISQDASFHWLRVPLKRSDPASSVDTSGLCRSGVVLCTTEQLD